MHVVYTRVMVSQKINDRHEFYYTSLVPFLCAAQSFTVNHVDVTKVQGYEIKLCLYSLRMVNR